MPFNDPTLLFTNAGMNQFKPIFLGTVDPKSEQATWKAVVNSQKCIRAGGKHNDLDDVGKDTYHHTFFEMLGNWSFGDYFQEEAISWAWELLTEVYKLDKSRLYVTYFGGDKEEGLDPDLSARDIWMRFLPKERILPFGKKENFWEMGETGPCGPCSEIHYDRIGGRNVAHLVNKDDPTVIEIWNLVFIQYNREPSGKLRVLPRKHVDTGMGLERLTSILQNKMSNYDTDLFQPIFDEIRRVTGAPPYEGKVGAEDSTRKDMAYRVIADHIRTLTIALTDGATPGPVGRGYVLRRILRRALRFGKEILKAPDGFFHQLVPVVVQKMGKAFPELTVAPDKVIRILELEERLFLKSLDTGLRQFAAIVKNLKAGDTIAPKDSLLLATTFGFDIELQKLMAEERGLKVNESEFHKLMKERKEQSRESAMEREGVVKLELTANAIARLEREMHIAPTDDLPKYELEEIEAHVQAIWTGLEREFQNSWKERNVIGLILDRTNFYAEAGGQLYDTGLIVGSSDSDSGRGNMKFVVENVQLFGGYVLHIGHLDEGEVAVQQRVNLTIDIDRRRAITSNHTSTHLVNFALRKVLGDTSDQKGSVVSPHRFRFDFSHNAPLTESQLKELDDIVCGIIAKELPIFTKEVPLETAKTINGIRAVFGERYPDPVRVVSVGVRVEDLLKAPSHPQWREYSIELCGGTHLSNTREAQAFTIIEEGPSAAGIRRLFAVTGEEARTAHSNADHWEEQCKQLEKLAETQNITALRQQFLTVRSEVDQTMMPYHRKLALRSRLNKISEILSKHFRNNVKEQEQFARNYVAELLKKVNDDKDKTPHIEVQLLDVGSDNGLLHNTCRDIVAGAKKPIAVLLVSVDVSKPDKPAVILCAHVSEALQEQGLKANEWVNAAATVVGGKGGGKAGQAQGRGNLPACVHDALHRALEFAQEKLHILLS